MRYVVAVTAVLAAGLLASACARDAAAPDRAQARRLDIDLVPDTEMVVGRVPVNATLDSLLRDQRLRADIIPSVVSLARSVFDPRRLRANQVFRLERTLDGLVRSFEYEIDGDHFLRIARNLQSPREAEEPGGRDQGTEQLRAQLIPYQKERALVSLHGRIDREATSLFAAMDVAGEKPDLSIQLADIFGGDIDFNSELQPGDSFRLSFEKVYREGQFSGYGDVLAAEFENDGRTLIAIRYTVPGGKPAYYDAKGRALKRFFLRSPLKFEAPVSSRFSTRRLHPVLRIVRPHLGVDYRAPSGSSVVAVANGTVVAAGWSGQSGRMVHLRHPGGYESYYLHLSSIAVSRGQHVGQGQLIGRVGTSGLSTGPHLDYRVRKSGKFVNPLLVHRSLPEGDPIPAAHLPQFQVERDRAVATLVAPVDAGGRQTPRP
jgi:murein DD-endopeptidase MepM/ murein hydrolase activator NlpD